MKKIVINRCFGGFGLSPAAIRMLAELQGRECYFFSTEIGNFDNKYTPVTGDFKNEIFGPTAFDIPNPTEVFAYKKDWHSMTMEERAEHNELYRKHSFVERDIPRDDPLLVRIVEELGDKASGRCAKLEIVEIPDDVKWTIEEYDGLEHVAEVHQTWE